MKFMLDHNLRSAAECLGDIGRVRVATLQTYGLPQHTDDVPLIKFAESKNLILVTNDRATIDEKKYPPQTHAGIIIFKGNELPKKEVVCARMKRLYQSGSRKSLRRNVTHLHKNKAVIYHSQTEFTELKF